VTNKVLAANAAGYTMVATVCQAFGLPESALSRNAMHTIDPGEGGDARDTGAESPLMLLVEYQDGRAVTESVSLSPRRYDLRVEPLITILTVGSDDEHAVARRTALIDALGAAIEADDTLGGAVVLCEIADDPEQEEDEEGGQVARGDLLSLNLYVSDARTARG
jgi:hypothetical protein